MTITPVTIMIRLALFLEFGQHGFLFDGHGVDLLAAEQRVSVSPSRAPEIDDRRPAGAVELVPHEGDVGFGIVVGLGRSRRRVIYRLTAVLCRGLGTLIGGLLCGFG